MTLHQLSATLKDSAREKLVGNYGNSVMLTITHSLIIFLINFAITMPVSFIAVFVNMLTGASQLGPGYTIAVYLLTLIGSIFLGVMNTGVSLFFLNLACGRTASVSDLFYGYRYLFKKSLVLSVVTTLASTIPLLPYNICYYMFDTTFSPEWGLLTALCYIIGALICIPISLAISQAFFLLLDFPQYSAKQLLSLSIRIMKGRKWKYFYIQLSFFPLLTLNLLSLGIGNLWLTPYMNMTGVLFFLDIMKSDTSK